MFFVPFFLTVLTKSENNLTYFAISRKSSFFAVGERYRRDISLLSTIKIN